MQQALSSDSESEDRHDAVHRLVLPSHLEGIECEVNGIKPWYQSVVSSRGIISRYQTVVSYRGIIPRYRTEVPNRVCSVI